MGSHNLSTAAMGPVLLVRSGWGRLSPGRLAKLEGLAGGGILAVVGKVPNTLHGRGQDNLLVPGQDYHGLRPPVDAVLLGVGNHLVDGVAGNAPELPVGDGRDAVIKFDWVLNIRLRLTLLMVGSLRW
jgi:hypothetical protein